MLEAKNRTGSVIVKGDSFGQIRPEIESKERFKLKTRNWGEKAGLYAHRSHEGSYWKSAKKEEKKKNTTKNKKNPKQLLFSKRGGNGKWRRGYSTRKGKGVANEKGL